MVEFNITPQYSCNIDNRHQKVVVVVFAYSLIVHFILGGLKLQFICGS